MTPGNIVVFQFSAKFISKLLFEQVSSMFNLFPWGAHARVAHARRAASCAVMLLARRLRPQACGATLKPGFRSEALGGPPPR